MSTTETTSSIDDKKTEDTGAATSNFKGFLFNYLYSIIFTITLGIFVIGGTGLYITKVANAHVLPDDISFAPYTDKINPVITKICLVKMNIIKPTLFSTEENSTYQTAAFDSKEYLDGFINSIICALKTWAQPENTLSNYGYYFSKVYDQIISYNFKFTTFLFGGLGHLPESAIMILYGLLCPIFLLVFFLFSMATSIVFHLINLGKIFTAKTTKVDKISSKDKMVWSNHIDWIKFVWNMVVFFFIGMVTCLTSTFLMPVFFAFYALISPLFAKYKIINEHNKEPITDNQNIGNFIKSTFVYKKLLFYVLATISLIVNGVNYLGSSAIVGIIIAIIIVYFLGLYQNYIPPSDNTDGFKPIGEASMISTPEPIIKQKCAPIPEEGVLEIEADDSWSQNINKPNNNQLGGGKQNKLKPKLKSTNSHLKKYNIRLV